MKNPFDDLFGENPFGGSGFEEFAEMFTKYSAEVPEARVCETTKELADWFKQAGNAAGAIARSAKKEQ